jgi:glyceraldehyde 3-phosphate dehydrogenase
MASPKVAINGFGRIGRTVTRIAKLRHHFDVVAINDIGSPEGLAYAFKYDSVHGIYPGEIKVRDGAMEIDGDEFAVLSEKDPAKLPWKTLGIDYVVEATGKFRHSGELQKHLDAGGKRVIVTVPTKDPLRATLVMGVNDEVVDQGSTIISAASCTTNCAATVHAYTSDQRLVDSPHNDLRRSRTAAMNIVPTSTGAARAIGEVMPKLKGKLDGIAMRVPVADGSLVDLCVELESDVTAEAVNAAMKAAAEGPLKGILAYCTDPIVSTDIIGNSHSSIFDAGLTMVMESRLVKVVSWYDNEWGYSTRVEDLVTRLAKMDGIKV